MDNDILLTRHSPELQWATDKKLARDNNFITYNDAMDMCEDACRAQLRKDVGTMYDEVICPLCYRLNPQHATQDNGKGCHWCQDKEDWLRAARGE